MVLVMRRNYSHPSIITWTPFNESWGVEDIENDLQQQKFTESIYALTKAIDPMRPVVTNDGWRHTCSDILTLHDYEASGEKFYDRYIEPENFLSNEELYSTAGQFFAFADGYEYEGQPIIISEFGGIALSDGEGWGYGNKVTDKASFLDRFKSITRAIQDLPYCSGYCLHAGHRCAAGGQRPHGHEPQFQGGPGEDPRHQFGQKVSAARKNAKRKTAAGDPCGGLFLCLLRVTPASKGACCLRSAR